MRERLIPFGAYWSTPFARWQGSLAHLHAFELAAHVAKSELARRSLSADAFDCAVLGTTVPQKSAFYGLPWVMGMIGNDRVGGPTINQACANGVRCALAAQQEIASELAETALVLAVNDIVFARETGAALMAMNNNGCSLVWGHPQGPTGLRGVIELVEELAARGGGYGLFTGCAAGDTAMAVVIELCDAAA